MAGREDEAVAVRPVRVRPGCAASRRGRAGTRAARAPSPCPGGRRSPSARRPSRARGSCRSTSFWSSSTVDRASGDATGHYGASTLRAHGRPDRIRRSARSSPATRSSTASRSRSSARDRLALAGPNGAGKTTLLRALIGETELAGRRARAARRAPAWRCTTSGRRATRGLTLREYALSGAADLVRSEQELRRLEQAMAAGDHDPATLRRYGEAQARLEHARRLGLARPRGRRPARPRLRATPTSTAASTPSPAAS